MNHFPQDHRELFHGALKFESLCSAVVLLFLLFILTGSVAAPLTPQDVIEADVAAQNDHNKLVFLSIRTNKAGPPESGITLRALWEKYPKCSLLLNVSKAKLVMLKSLPLDLTISFTGAAEYFGFYSELKAYYVAIDYEFRQETRHLYEGVNYRLYILAPEEGRWVIVEASEAPVQRIIEAGSGFATPEEKLASSIQKERERTGKFINAKGEIIDNSNCTRLNRD